MKVLPFDKDISKYLSSRGLEKKFEKQISFLINNPRHPSLNLELLEPKDKGIYSFRINIKYRVLFFYRVDLDAIEILAVTDHYQ